MLSSWRMYEMHLALFLKAGCDSDAQQAFRERAGVVRFLGIGALRGDGARPRLKREVDARRAPR
jgi:hypothetical protein